MVPRAGDSSPRAEYGPTLVLPAGTLLRLSKAACVRFRRPSSFIPSYRYYKKSPSGMASRRAPAAPISGAGDTADPFPRLSSDTKSREVAGRIPEAQGPGPSRRMVAPGPLSETFGVNAAQPPHGDAAQQVLNAAPCPPGQGRTRQTGPFWHVRALSPPRGATRRCVCRNQCEARASPLSHRDARVPCEPPLR